MELHKSRLFEQFPEIIFGISPKFGFERGGPFFYNMSLTVGDDKEKVWENREHFANTLGLRKDQVAFQKQIHSDIVTLINEPVFAGESDAMITDKSMIGLAVSTADCTPIFLYDQTNKVIAGVHSGWRGTEKQILVKTIKILIDKYFSKPQNIYAYIGPSISQLNYEVGNEVASLFEGKYSIKQPNGKFLLDVKQVNFDLLVNYGIPESNIEISPVCSFGDKNLHSYRRDKENSGRSLGIIAMRG